MTVLGTTLTNLAFCAGLAVVAYMLAFIATAVFVSVSLLLHELARFVRNR